MSDYQAMQINQDHLFEKWHNSVFLLRLSLTKMSSFEVLIESTQDASHATIKPPAFTSGGSRSWLVDLQSRVRASSKSIFFVDE